MVKLGSTETKVIYIGDEPIGRIYHADSMVKNYLGLIPKCMFTKERPSPYIQIINFKGKRGALNDY